MTALNWQGAVVDRLIDLRAQGYGFDTAWSAAIHEVPVRDDCSPRLFDEIGQRTETLVSFFRRACESAYLKEVGEPGSGVGSALGNFRPEMIRSLDESAPAKRVGRSRAFRAAA